MRFINTSGVQVITTWVGQGLVMDSLLGGQRSIQSQRLHCLPLQQGLQSFVAHHRSPSLSIVGFELHTIVGVEQLVGVV